MARFDRPGLRLIDEVLKRHQNTITGRPSTDAEALCDLLADIRRWAHEHNIPFTRVCQESEQIFRETLDLDRRNSLPFRKRVGPALGK